MYLFYMIKNSGRILYNMYYSRIQSTVKHLKSLSSTCALFIFYSEVMHNITFPVPDWPIQRCNSDRRKYLKQKIHKGYIDEDMCDFITFDNMCPDDLHLRIRISSKLFNQVVMFFFWHWYTRATGLTKYSKSHQI